MAGAISINLMDIKKIFLAVVDLIPVKQELERINAECFFREDIEFNRFKVIGQDENEEA